MTARPCRLELNNSGAWKLLARFDASNDAAADAIVEAAAQLARAINNPACGRTAHTSLRISTDAAHPMTLMHWTPEAGAWAKAEYAV